jgi:uncharacterized protein
MNSTLLFDRICSAMEAPAFYPHPVSGVRRIETHISVVFLTGKWAYKLKKPLNLGFLDFRDLFERKEFCLREVALNQRLSHGVYQGVISIVEDPEKGFIFSETGEPVEYAVKMTELADADRLENRLKAKTVSRIDMEALGRMLAQFYDKSDRGDEIDAFGRRDTVIYNSEENFRQIAPYVDRIVDPERWGFICEVNRSFLFHHHALFEQRIEGGRIRDGHGDLRTDHIYLDGGIQVIDCIEFNERFRYGDAALDLAFLHMDLEKQGFPEFSQAMLTGYADAAMDPGLYAILDFYAAYRAIVRLKIACLRYDEVTTEADQKVLRADMDAHLAQAFRYTVRFSRPTLWIFCGLPASGKSALAGRVAGALSMAVYNSDQLRKENPSAPEIVSFGKGAYTPEKRRHIYTLMLALAQERLKTGRSVALDATFGEKTMRHEVSQLASDMDVNLIFVECHCSKKTLISRLKSRDTLGGISDARVSNIDEIAAHFEPMAELSSRHHIKANTDEAIDKTLHRILSEAYLLKSAQIESRI